MSFLLIGYITREIHKLIVVRVLESWPLSRNGKLLECNAAHCTTNKEFHTSYEFLPENIEYIAVCAIS